MALRIHIRLSRLYCPRRLNSEVCPRAQQGMIDGDCPSNSWSRLICALRLPGSSGSSFRNVSNLLHNCSAVLGIYVNAVAHEKPRSGKKAPALVRTLPQLSRLRARLAILKWNRRPPLFGYQRERLFENSGPCGKEPLAIRTRRVVNGERRSRPSKVLTGAFVPWFLIMTPFGRKGKHLERRADIGAHFAALDRIDEDARASRCCRARSNSALEPFQRVPG